MGFNEKNLRRMIQFAEVFPEEQIVVTLSRQLGWSHFVSIIQVMQWKQRRKPALDQGEVGLTIRNLAALNWLDVKASDDLPLSETVV